MIIRSTGSWYDVQLEDGKILQCRMKGKFRLDGKKLTNPVAVGDFVMIEKEHQQEVGVIKSIEDRKNYVVRQSPRKKHFLHIIAANIDQAILIVTIKSPNLKQGFIDRFLLMTEPYNIPVHIFFNKCDLYEEADLEIYNVLAEIYEKIGYHCYLTSAISNVGLKDMQDIIKNKVSLFSGQSGVGKSSLINLLLPDFQIKTKILSDFTGKGQHTTTFAEMYNLGEGTKIIDSPGIKTLSYNHLKVQDVAHNFREFFTASKHCKFADCTHRNEPKCAIKNGLDNGEFSELRYFNYLQILEDIEDQNYWERNLG